MLAGSERNDGPIDPLLPANDPNPQQRAEKLWDIRNQYEYLSPSENLLEPLSVATTFPFWVEIWKWDWAIPLLPRVLRTVLNLEPKGAWFWLRGLFPDFDKLAAYRALFSPLLRQPAPPQYADDGSDVSFARERLDGPNPWVIRKITSPEDLATRMALPAERASELAADASAGNLFVADYSLIAESLLPADRPWAKAPTVMGRDSRWRPKYLPAPVALFRLGSDGNLAPVAIRIDQPNAAPPNPVWTPDIEGYWDIAKLYVRVADANLHEHSSHNYRHHFVAGIIAATTRRQLSPIHPVYLLLEPHIAHTLFVNRIIYGTLHQPGKSVDEQFAGDLEETRQITINSFKQWNWTALSLTADLAARGVDKTPVSYPWRDDALLWLDPIARFVGTYIRLFYNDDNAVANDIEMQQWSRELEDRLPGVAPEGTIKTIDQLIAVLSQMLFTTGPGHASAHFPLTEYLMWAPGYPRSAYAAPPGPFNDQAPPQRIANTLPSVARAITQFKIGQFAGYQYGRFGDYHKYRLSRVAQAQGAITALGKDLQTVESTIEARNKTRPRAYTYLLPRYVPNSINL
jgi:arachidonate 15-lipoxygenase